MLRARLTHIYIYIYILKTILIVLAFTFFNLSNVLRKIYIDSFVGVAAGAAIAHAMRQKERPAYRNAVVFLSCATLVLAKDVGIFFAVFVVIINCVTQIRYERSEDKLIGECAKPRIRKQEVIFLLLSVGCIAVPKLLWKLQIRLDNAAIRFSDPYDLGVLLDILLGRDTTYRSEIIPGFFAALVSDSFPLGGFPAPYLFIFILLLALLFFITVYVQKQNSASCSVKSGKYTYFIIFLVMSVTYLLGLPITYIFKFSELEATILACLSRYIGILFACMWIAAALNIISAERSKHGTVYLAAFTAFIILCTNWSTVGAYTSKDNVRNKYTSHHAFSAFADSIHEYLGETDAKIYVVSQGDVGSFFLLSRYSLRPYQVNDGYPSSIGEAPLYEGDIWTEIISPEDWEARVLNDYDYVLLCDLNDYFIEAYADFFDNSIRGFTLYEVDKADGVCRSVPLGSG